MFIISSTKWAEESPTNMPLFETESWDDVIDAITSAKDNGATQIHISIEKNYNSEGIENLYED